MSEGDGVQDEQAWFAVRCVFASGWASRKVGRPLYEERITLWRAPNVEDAVSLAETDAAAYAAAIDDAPDTYLGLAQAYRLDGPPGEGSEVFSLLRASNLPPEDYLDTFFDTGAERERGI